MHVQQHMRRGLLILALVSADCLRPVAEGGPEHPPCAAVPGFTGRVSAEAYDDAGAFLGWTLTDARCPQDMFCYLLTGPHPQAVCLQECAVPDGGAWLGAAPCAPAEVCADLWDPVLQGPVEPGGGCVDSDDAITAAGGGP